MLGTGLIKGLIETEHNFMDSYHDEAVGVMTRNERGIPWVSLVTLNPKIVYSGEKLPMPADEEQLHHRSHEQCYIANSIKTEVRVGETKHDA